MPLFDSSILLENTIDIVQEFKDVSKSHFIQALEHNLNIDIEYKNNVNNLYKSISESADEIAINEAFENFFKSVKEILDKNTSFVSSEFTDFCTELTKANGKDRDIMNNKSFYMNYKSDIYQTLDLYKFTNLDSKIPKKIIKVSYIEEYDKLQNILSSRSKDINTMIDDINALCYEVTNSINNGFYDKFRANMLGLSGTVSKLEFSNTLFNIFRNGGQKNSTIVDTAYVKDAYNRFVDSKKYINTLKIEKKAILKEYEQIKNDIKNIKFDQITSNFGSRVSELEDKFNMYVKIKVDQIINLCNNYNLAYMAKLDAISSCYLQDRYVLLSIVNNIDNDGGDR